MTMTDTERVALVRMARQVLSRGSLGDFCQLMSVAGYQQPAQVLALIGLLERIERREVTRAIVEMPPRSSKSTHVSRLFPAWWLGRHASDNVIIASYGEELATGHGREVRNLIESPDYPFETTMRADSRAAGRWQTEQGGGLIAAGVGTGLTGFGGHLMILDDPVKGREEAESVLTRDHTWAWYQEVFLTRLQKNGVVVVLGTRWHEDDPIGRILNSKGADSWERLRIPYIAGVADQIGRQPGEVLDVFGEVPSVERGEISSYGFSALYQQSPTPASGGVFRKEWMTRRYCTCGRPQVCGNMELPTKTARWNVFQSMDIGGKQGVGHDPSALATWGTDGISKFVLDYWSSQVEYSDVKSHVVTQWRKWRPRMMYVEDATWAQPLISDLRRESGVRVHGVPTRGNKWTRADAVSPEFEGGRVVLPEDATWLPDWMHDHVAFPAATHDEAVDTTSLMLSQMKDQPGRTRMVRLNDKGAVDGIASVEKMRLRMKEFLRG